MNPWQSRLMTGAIIALAMWLHGFALADVPNTDTGMLVFHGTAAAVDLLLLRFTPLLLEGPLCDDMQILFWVSIAANSFGWVAYTNYVSPVYYNTFMWGHVLAQAIRLSIVDGDYDSPFRSNLVRRGLAGWAKHHHTKAHQ